MTGRIDSLQVLRLLAAAMVAWLHISQAGRMLDGVPLYGGVVSNIGSFGVDVFFVLSGFIIAKTAVGKTPAEFLRLRLTRVVPIYWLMTIAILPFLIQAGEFTWTPLVSTLSFYPGLGRPYLKVGWTRPLLEKLLKAMKASPRDILRVRGTQAEALGLTDPKTSDDKILAAMVADPALVERPIVVTPKGVALCRPMEKVEALL